MSNPTTPARWATRTASAVALLVTVLLVVPFSPFIAGLHGERWPYAMNAAAADHLIFGKDIVFTAGPLSSIFTRAYHPAMDAYMMGGLTLLAVALFLGFAAITPAPRRAWLLALPLVVNQFSFEPAMVMALPFLWVMVAERSALRQRWSRTAMVFLLGAACTLLTLVKGSMTIAVAVSAVFAFICVWGRSRTEATALVAYCFGILVATWMIVGQPLSALPAYFISQIPVVSGYTEAMALNGNTWESIAFPFFALITLWALTDGSGIRRWRVLVPLALLQFLCFKAGYVRHDMHALIPAVALAFSGLVAFVEKPGPTTRGMIGAIAGTVGCIALSVSYQSYDPGAVRQRLVAQLDASVTGLKTRLFQPGTYALLYRQETDKVRSAYPLPTVQGDVDLYPEDVASVIASGSKWNPRPAVISYSAYTPSLATLDADHLKNHGASRVYFGIMPIDERYPTLEDGASWPELIGQYSSNGFVREYAILDRHDGQSTLTLGATTESRHTLGNEISLRDRTGPVWAKINITPTLLGRLAAAAYKLPRLHISVTYPDGGQRTYTLVPGMAASGFLLSPTVSNAVDFASLHSRKQAAILGPKMPVSMRIYGDRGTRVLWHQHFDVQLQDISIVVDPRVDESLLDNLFNGPPVSSLAVGGDCRMDTMNGRDLGSLDVPTVGEAITVRGWALVSAAGGIPHDRVEIALVQGDKTVYSPTHPESRPDVGASFGQPDVTTAGFAARIDTTGLHGDYAMHIVQVAGDKRLACPTIQRVRFR